MKNNLLVLSVVTVSTLFTVSCVNSKNQSLGERIASEGNAVADIGKDWQKGEDMIQKGEKLRKSGKKDIEKGEDLIKKGRSKKEKAEKSYNTATSA